MVTEFLVGPAISTWTLCRQKWCPSYSVRWYLWSCHFGSHYSCTYWAVDIFGTIFYLWKLHSPVPISIGMDFCNACFFVTVVSKWWEIRGIYMWKNWTLSHQSLYECHLPKLCSTTSLQKPWHMLENWVSGF